LTVTEFKVLEMEPIHVLTRGATACCFDAGRTVASMTRRFDPIEGLSHDGR
jgi:hypothetical protein